MKSLNGSGYIIMKYHDAASQKLWYMQFYAPWPWPRAATMIAHIVNYEHDQCRQCRHLLAGAILAEDIPAVPAVVLPVGEAEGLAAAGAGHHLGVVLPLPPGLLHQLHLHNIVWIWFTFLSSSSCMSQKSVDKRQCGPFPPVLTGSRGPARGARR